MGWMIRQAANSRKIYDPRTVKDKVDLTADTTVSIPAIFDLKQREVLWIDLNLTRNIAWGGANNVEANQKGMVLIGKTMTTMRKPT